MLRIPKRVVLPFGYVITVKQLSNKEVESLLGVDTIAGWVVEDKSIYLDKSRPVKKRRADLAHELVHALADWQAHVLGTQMGDAKH